MLSANLQAPKSGGEGVLHRVSAEVKHVAGPQVYDELVKKYPELDVRHEWLLKGMSKEQLDKIRKDYEERYGKAAPASK